MYCAEYKTIKTQQFEITLEVREVKKINSTCINFLLNVLMNSVTTTESEDNGSQTD